MHPTGKAIRVLRVLIFIFPFLHFFSSLSAAGGIGRPTASTDVQNYTKLSFTYEHLEPEIDSSHSAFRGKAREERMLLRAGYSPMRFVDVYLRLGVAAHETPSRNFNGSLGPAYGAGARWTFYQKKDLALGMGLQFLEYWTRDGGGAASRLRWDEIEWYAGGTLEGFDWMVPYFGVRLTEARGDFRGGPTVHLRHFIDLFIGADFHVYERFSFLTEARFLHENGLSVALAYDL